MPDIWMDCDTALSEVPVNLMPLLDDGDFKTIEGAVAYNAAGMALRWHFVTTGGAYTVTSVTPTTGGTYDWTDQGDSGIYTIEIPASGGASINNDSEGFGWFSGSATGILPWRGPVIGFRAAGLNDLLIDSAYSTTRGLAGTALPNAAAEASGGLATLSAAQASNGTIPANVHRWLTGTPNALISGRVDSNPGALQASVITATSIATGAITSAKFAAGAIDAAAIANSAIDAATFAADVDAEFLSYIVDDATRIDASALNTLSSHDPGAALGTSTLTQTQVTGGAYALNSSSFGFHSSLDLTTTQKASVNTEADTALVDAKAAYAAAIEAAILDEGDATALLAAIAAKVEEFLVNEGDATATIAAIATAVWSAGTRRLTDGTNIVLAKGTGITGFNDLSAAQVNAEAAAALATYDGPTNAEMVARTLAAADYATAAALASLVTTVGAAGVGLTEAGGTGDQLTAIPKTGYELASTGLDLVLVAGVNVPESLRRIGAITCGEVSGAGTGTETFLDWAESAASVVITVDSSGNRTSVVFN